MTRVGTSLSVVAVLFFLYGWSQVSAFPPGLCHSFCKGRPVSCCTNTSCYEDSFWINYHSCGRPSIHCCYTVSRGTIGVLAGLGVALVLCGCLVMISLFCCYRLRKKRSPPHACDYCAPPTFSYQIIPSEEEQQQLKVNN